MPLPAPSFSRPDPPASPRSLRWPRGLAVLLPGLFLASACGDGREASEGTADGGGACPSLAGETVDWIVPYTPGGGYDVLSRVVEPYLEEALGAQVVVRNRPGAGGLVGARVVRDAEPDGRTLGLVNGTGLLVHGLQQDVPRLHPVDDYTLLGRLTASEPVWFAGPDSPRRTLEAFLAGGGPPVLFGISDVLSVGFISASVGSRLLGLEVEYLAGYPGSRENSLGLIRGEMDLAGFTFESVRGRVEAGDLRPVLQVSDAAVAPHPALEGVPTLAGDDGVAVRRARELGGDPEEARRRAQALARLFDVGRVVVAPPGLPAELTACLEGALAGIAGDPAFLAAAAQAGRPVLWSDAGELVEGLRTTEAARGELATVLREEIRRVREGGS